MNGCFVSLAALNCTFVQIQIAFVRQAAPGGCRHPLLALEVLPAMEMSEEIRINAPRERVFAALNDVEILKQSIPGCEELEAVSPTEFTAVVVSRVGPLKAKFKGGVTLTDVVAPVSYTMVGEGKGGPAGFAKMRTHVRLDDEGEATLMRYEVQADIGGKLAQLGGALITKTSKKLAGVFFKNFEAIVSGDVAPGA